MKYALPLGIVFASFLVLAGAGCAPQAAQKQAPAAGTQAPADQAEAQKTGDSAGASADEAVNGEAPEKNESGVTEDDLKKLKLDVESMQFEDLSAPKN